MATLTVRTHIPAPPEAVWAVLEDFEHQRDWMVDIRSLRIVSQQTHGAGTILDATSAVFGLPIVKDLIEVTAWDPPYRMDVRRDTPPAGFGRFALRGTGSFILEPSDGGTTFTWIEDFRPPLGPLGELAWKLLVGPHMRRVVSRSMANVYRLACARSEVALNTRDCFLNGTHSQAENSAGGVIAMRFLRMMAHFWLVLVLAGLGALVADFLAGMVGDALNVDLTMTAYRIIDGLAYMAVLLVLVKFWYRPTWRTDAAREQQRG